jgi:C4-type Zn-finger protein
MKCPICLSEDIREMTVHSTEPHGERFEEDILVCSTCGAHFLEEDLPEVPEELELYQ